MIPSSEFYDNYESNIEELLENLQNIDEINDRVACPEISSLSIEYLPPGSCNVQLATETKRDAGQTIRVVHYNRTLNVIESDNVYNGNDDDCNLQGIIFPINALSSGNIFTYIAIMDVTGSRILLRNFVQWTSC